MKKLYDTYLDKDKDIVHKIPYLFSSIDILLSIDDEMLQEFLWNNLGSNELVEDLEDNRFVGSDIQDFQRDLKDYIQSNKLTTKNLYKFLDAKFGDKLKQYYLLYHLKQIPGVNSWKVKIGKFRITTDFIVCGEIMCHSLSIDDDMRDQFNGLLDFAIEESQTEK